MSAPLSIAQMMPFDTPETVPDPFEFKTLTGRIRTLGEPPATPTMLAAVAPMIPDTWLP